VRASTTLAALTTAGAAGLGYALVEARMFTLRSFTIPVLPEGTPALRVLCLSDLHLVPRQRSKMEWVRSLAGLEPDLVVSTGDNLAAMDAVPTVLRAHGDLLERPGVFVLGSNDYWAPRVKNPARYLLQNGGARRVHGQRLPTDDLVGGFRAAGWLDLTNRRDSLKIGSTLLEFVGVDDPHLGYDRCQDVAGPADPAADLTVGVTHAPYRRVLDAMVSDGAELLLAGHTHGGQLCLPGVGALVTNCDLPRRQAKGVSRWPITERSPGVPRASRPEPAADLATGRAAWLHVSAGLGTSPFTPVRFACRPEASLVTLIARDALA
jgi:predicted MPP superfamily phosphohydrolase